MKKITYTGFSRKQDKTITVVSWQAVEMKTKETLYAIFDPDTIIECREYKSGYLFDELRLDELF
jgi:hypothetical protein